MAKLPARRVGEYNPDVETGETLDTIEGTDIEIQSVAFEERRGRNGEYTLVIIETVDGKRYHTGSPVIAEKLGRVPSNDFPVLATFRRIQSQSNPRNSYWDVS